MQYFLNSIAILQVAGAAIRAGVRGHRHSEEFTKLTVAYVMHQDYIAARMPL